MSDETKEEQDAVFRVDTVPPPAGEDDAYSAPTRIGQLPDSVLESMKDLIAGGAGGRFPPPPPVPASQPRPPAAPQPASTGPASTGPASTGALGLPRVNDDDADDEDDDDDAYTLLSAAPPGMPGMPGMPPALERGPVSGIAPLAARSERPAPLTAPFGPMSLAPIPHKERSASWLSVVAIALAALAVLGMALLVAC